MLYERFTVLQGCWFNLPWCDGTLKSYTKDRWTTGRKPVSLSTAGLFVSSRHFCSFPDLKQWSSSVTPLFGWNKTLLWVCLAIVKEGERLKHKMLDSGYSWVKPACKCNCGQKTWAVCRAVFSSALYSQWHLFFKLKKHHIFLCLLFRLSKKLYERKQQPRFANLKDSFFLPVTWVCPCVEDYCAVTTCHEQFHSKSSCRW